MWVEFSHLEMYKTQSCHTAWLIVNSWPVGPPADHNFLSWGVIDRFECKSCLAGPVCQDTFMNRKKERKKENPVNGWRILFLCGSGIFESTWIVYSVSSIEADLERYLFWTWLPFIKLWWCSTFSFNLCLPKLVNMNNSGPRQEIRCQQSKLGQLGKKKSWLMINQKYYWLK